MRKIISIILVAAFIIVSVSGVQMVIAPKHQNVQQQMISVYEPGISLNAGQMPLYPKKAHEWAGYLFIGAGLAHLVFNRKSMFSYFKF